MHFQRDSLKGYAVLWGFQPGFGRDCRADAGDKRGRVRDFPLRDPVPGI